MRVVTYNINGIRASVKLGLDKWIEQYDADIYCFQEVRCNEELSRQLLFKNESQMDFFSMQAEQSPLKAYTPIFNCGSVAGYAGTLTLTKLKPDKVVFGMDEFWQDNEGRTTTIFIKDYAIINAYIPNGNSRLDFKMQYLDALNKFIAKLQSKYKVVCVGDYNIAHNEIDLTNPKECKNKSVFLPIERQAFSDLLSLGMIDCFREQNRQTIKYSWRSYRSRWDNSYHSWKYRIDYILASQSLKNSVSYCDILELDYSDHLPVVADFKI